MRLQYHSSAVIVVPSPTAAFNPKSQLHISLMFFTFTILTLFPWHTLGDSLKLTHSASRLQLPWTTARRYDGLSREVTSSLSVRKSRRWRHRCSRAGAATLDCLLFHQNSDTKSREWVCALFWYKIYKFPVSSDRTREMCAPSWESNIPISNCYYSLSSWHCHDLAKSYQ